MLQAGNFILPIFLQLISYAMSQGPFNFASKKYGENFGDLTPGEIAGICVAAVAFVGGLVVTGFFCYYVHKKQSGEMSVSVFRTTKHVPLSTYVQ